MYSDTFNISHIITVLFAIKRVFKSVDISLVLAILLLDWMSAVKFKYTIR